MLLGLAVTSWLLAASVSGLTSSSRIAKTRADDDDDREAYWKHANSEQGMCKTHSKADNVNRRLRIPGKGVLREFPDCVAKNEFGEALRDRSGEIFCQGLGIHLLADATNHEKDSKFFVDQATTLNGEDFAQELKHLQNAGLAGTLTAQQIVDAFKVDGSLKLGEPGTELNYYNNSRFPTTPKFLFEIRPQARRLQAWAKIVHHFWNKLDRTMDQTFGDYLIPGPGSDPDEDTEEKYSTTLIRLEHPFVVAGGRFREQYYWDSFFIMEGLLAANMGYLARTTLLNFMDQIKAYGFIPNGGRKYYLNRSQPPLFIHMLHAYVEHTQDVALLHEALPLAERELRWWYRKRSIKVRHQEKDYTVFRYNVKATGPRPESYGEDWRSAWCNTEEAPTEEGENLLYSEFASGAESGWDYTARWMSKPFDRGHLKKVDQMKHLQTSRVIPVDLNSMIYRCHKLMERLYEMARNNESPFAHEYGNRHAKKAEKLREAILALHWDSESFTFFDFVLNEHKPGKHNTGSIQKFWSGASLVPYWAQIWPEQLDCTNPKYKAAKNNTMKAFSGVRELLRTYPGPLPATVVKTGQQWDFPNSWPPLQYFAIKALYNIDSQCISGTTTDQFKDQAMPNNHLGSGELPTSNTKVPDINYKTSPSWRDVLLKTVLMRYMNSAFCTWNLEGKLPEDRVEFIMRDNAFNDNNLYKHPGEMYEKLSAESPLEPGGGGEYSVQTGFGWTNGVAIWVAQQFGAILDDPDCTKPQTPSAFEPNDSIVFQK